MGDTVAAVGAEEGREVPSKINHETRRKTLGSYRRHQCVTHVSLLRVLTCSPRDRASARFRRLRRGGVIAEDNKNQLHNAYRSLNHWSKQWYDRL